MIIREIRSKTILSASKIHDYVINPYIGCHHGCSYCYARFIKKFTGHQEPWGEFVDIKINAAELLHTEIRKKKPGTVWVSGLCDPYQPLEESYQITRECLEILIEHHWPVIIQTRSPLVLRDLDIIRKAERIEVGFSVTTADDDVRKIFEPEAPSIAERLDALEKLHSAGIRTFAMVAPMLPGAENLGKLFPGKADRVLVDRMNYHYADYIYHNNRFEDKLGDEFFRSTGNLIAQNCSESGLACNLVF